MLVDLVNTCETFHTLPRAGGLLDQDAFLMFLFRQVLLNQQERAAMDRRSSGGA